MSTEYLEIFFYVLGDSRDDQIYDRIIGEIQKIDDTITVSHTVGTNVIFVLSRWREPEVEQRIAHIRKIADVRNVIVGNKKHVKHIIESASVKVSEDVTWVLERDWIGLIEKTLNDKDYYSAISLSCTTFQNFGRKILSNQADLKTVINDLHDQGMIDKTVFNKMQKARELRNIYQHEDRAIKFSSEQAEEAEQTCIEALDCVKVLKKI
ncbi:MAG: DUF4145 domain-containing protein [Candidatus Nitrosopolaris sp.]